MEDNRLYLMLGEMQGMLKSIITSLDDTKADHSELKKHTADRLNQHSTRIVKIEQFQWKIMGIVGAGLVLIPIALTLTQMFILK